MHAYFVTFQFDDDDESFQRTTKNRRLEKRIYIPLPSEAGRKELFRINLGDVEARPTHVRKQARQEVTRTLRTSINCAEGGGGGGDAL